MKKYLMFGVLIFLIAVGTLPVWSSGKAEPDEGQERTVYYICNQDGQHVQVLGGKSIHAYNGLARAQQRARFVEVYTPSTKPKPRDGVDEVVPKKKK